MFNQFLRYLFLNIAPNSIEGVIDLFVGKKDHNFTVDKNTNQQNLHCQYFFAVRASASSGRMLMHIGGISLDSTIYEHLNKYTVKATRITIVDFTTGKSTLIEIAVSFLKGEGVMTPLYFAFLLRYKI